MTNVTIWGNHSTTQVPDFVNAKIDSKSAVDVIGDEVARGEIHPAIQTRGGCSSRSGALLGGVHRGVHRGRR